MENHSVSSMIEDSMWETENITKNDESRGIIESDNTSKTVFAEQESGFEGKPDLQEIEIAPISSLPKQEPLNFKVSLKSEKEETLEEKKDESQGVKEPQI
jgi:hypothetical protein